jgi:hypothetical protein
MSHFKGKETLMRRSRLLSPLILAAAVAAAGAARADEKPAASPHGEKAKAAPAGMPSQEEMMKKWEAYATPGAAHRKLDAFVGNWNVRMKAWMAPGQPPEQTEGTAETSWILGNRYLEQKYDGKMMGKPFSGVGFTGYDNFKKKYEAIWMDNMGTGVMTSTGSFDKSGKVMRFTATMDDPITGKKTTIKETLTIVDPDTHRLEMWATGPDGKMFKTLEGVYTRKK